MTRAQYNSIRNEPDFLYRYFKKAGGMDVGNQRFTVMLNAWLAQNGVHPRIGHGKIMYYLDRKFGQ